MIKRLTERFYYFACIAFFLFACGTLVFLYPEGRSFFVFNGLFAAPLDWFFSWYTHIGDGITAVVICVLLIIFYNFGSGIVALIGLGIIALISYCMKYYLFSVSPRPRIFFWGNNMIHYVDGVKVHIENSFPSGHSLTAFFIFTFMALLSFSRPAFMQCFLALLTILAAYSRVYLAQHFVGDIITGAAIGIIMALLCYKVYTKTKNINFLNKSVLRLLKK